MGKHVDLVILPLDVLVSFSLTTNIDFAYQESSSVLVSNQIVTHRTVVYHKFQSLDRKILDLSREK